MESNSCEVDVPSVENNHPDFGFNSSDNSDHEEVKSNKLNDPIIQDKPKLNKLQYKNLRFNDLVEDRPVPSIMRVHEHEKAMPLIRGQQSLIPDMKFGWKPEVKTSHPPIPLYFDFVEHTFDFYNFGDDIDESDVVVYQGQRFIDSYKMHKQYANKQLVNGHQTYKFNFPKNHEGGRFVDDGFIGKIFGSRNLEREKDDDMFEGMSEECIEVNQKQPEDKENKYLIFDGNFESGNLDYVVKNYPSNSYDLFLRPDTNTSGYFQWFYFRVQNKKKGTKMKMNIVNLTKRNSLYQQGMPVQILSMRKAQEQGINWAFGGDNIKYGISKLMKNQMCFGGEEQAARRRIYFQLSLEYTFEYDDDTVYFAYSLPYTFTMVNNLVQMVQESQDKVIQEYKKICKEENFNDPNVTENNFKVVETSIISSSLAGIEVPVLTITDFSHSKYEEKKKKVVIITGRVHPGESNSSWIVHGMIKFLMSKDRVASELRKKLIFKIVPMLNADGVTIGNSRCSMIGKDMNRMFGSPNKQLAPEPTAMRQLVKDLLKIQSHKVLSYLDVHAHSQKKSIFMYGPYFPLHSSKYLKIRAIPKLVSERTEMFRFFSCKFKFEKYKENCARLAIWRDYNITHTFTIETSSFGFLNRNRETIHFNTGLLQEFGECIVHSIFEFNLIQEEDRKMKIELAKKLKEQRKTRKLTIAEILSRSNIQQNDQHRHSRRNQPPLENNQNPNEPNDELVNLEIKPMTIEQQEQLIQENAELDGSIDSEGWGGDSDTDSSNVEESKGSPDPHGMPSQQRAGAFRNEQANLNQLNSRYNNVEFQSNILSGKVQEFLNRRKGLEICDGEELYHKLYNPFYTEWLMRRKQYIKYEQMVKMQKKNSRRYNSRPQHDDNHDDMKRDGSMADDDFVQRQKDQFYTKEIRTFDEVFKAIKKEEVQNKQRRQIALQKKYSMSGAIDDGQDDSSKDDDESDDEIHSIPDNLVEQDDQDIDESDRQVLNDRILGIINVFQSLSQAQGTVRKFPNKHLRQLQDLAKKALSIENKYHETPPRSPALKPSPTKQLEILHKMKLDEQPRKAPGGNPLGAINYLNQHSNTELIIKNSGQKPRNFGANSYKKKRQQYHIVNCQDFQNQLQQKPKCNIYNLGILPITADKLTQQQKNHRLKGGKISNKLNYIRQNIELVNDQQTFKANHQRMPHFFTSQNSTNTFMEKQVSPSHQTTVHQQQITSDYGSIKKSLNREQMSRILIKNQSTNQFINENPDIGSRTRPSFTMSSQHINHRVVAGSNELDPQIAQMHQQYQPTQFEQQICTLTNYQLEQQVKAKQAYFNAQIAKANEGGRFMQIKNAGTGSYNSRPMTGNFNNRKISHTDKAPGRQAEPNNCNSLIRQIINDTEISLQQTTNRRLNTAKKRVETKEDQKFYSNFQQSVLQGVSVHHKTSAKKKILSPVHNSQQLNPNALMQFLNPGGMHTVYKLDTSQNNQPKGTMMPTKLPQSIVSHKQPGKSQTITKPQKHPSQKMKYSKETSRVKHNNQIYVIDNSNSNAGSLLKGQQIITNPSTQKKGSAQIFINSGILMGDINESSKVSKQTTHSKHKMGTHNKHTKNPATINKSINQNSDAMITIAPHKIKLGTEQLEKMDQILHRNIRPGELYSDGMREPVKLNTTGQNASSKNLVDSEMQQKQFYIKMRRDI